MQPIKVIIEYKKYTDEWTDLDPSRNPMESPAPKTEPVAIEATMISVGRGGSVTERTSSGYVPVPSGLCLMPDKTFKFIPLKYIKAL